MTKSAIVLVVDRLGTGCLGAYGNTWVETPSFNALAAGGMLLENVLADSPDLRDAYRGYFTGRHVLQADAGEEDETIIRGITDAGARALLVTDDPQVAELPATEDMHEKLLVQSEPPKKSAGDIEETALAKLFAEAVDVLQRQRSPFLLWIHARGMNAPWDAPLALRAALADDEDPDPLECIDAPSLKLPQDYDPDMLLGIAQAYAAQVMVLDACLGVLLDAVKRHPLKDELLTIVTSPRGFPLGEHGIVGDCEDVLFGELLHVPLFLSRGDGVGALSRDHSLTQSSDIAATLYDWFGLTTTWPSPFAQSLLPMPVDDRVASHRRDRVISIEGDQRSIRTPAWFLRESPWNDSLPPSEMLRQLYRKPDDRWEVNDVSIRCPQIVEQLVAAMDACEQAIRERNPDKIGRLPDELIVGLD